MASWKRGAHDDVDYSPRSKTPVGQMFGMFSALGDVAFAYAGHNVVLEIQATIPSTPEKPSKGPMWLGCVVAYIIVAICYFPVAIIGFYVFGNTVDDNILITLEHPPWLIASANMFVIIHVIGGYQVCVKIFFLLMSLHYKMSKSNFFFLNISDFFDACL